MKYQSGRSMLEMIAVVGIIGILTVAGVSGLGGGTASMRATSAQYDIEEYAKRMIELNAWNRDGSFTDGFNGTLDKSDLSGNLSNVSSAGNGNSFSFTYGSLSQRECRLLVDKKFAEVCPGNCAADGNGAWQITFTYRVGAACP